ncbi:hypothetical protein Godav_025263 [Gossypium davidsonii]|uniref:Uncharacterized protein n=1 Tax=Gossypium davidsonii TaxID=34287 RepID=A0A7J8T9E7_GOSDV|nr:hypothetical protein [Gossypium davidsonii]
MHYILRKDISIWYFYKGFFYSLFSQQRTTHPKPKPLPAYGRKNST